MSPTPRVINDGHEEQRLRRRGRWVLVGALLFLGALIVVVVLAVVLVGIHNNGVKIPPGGPTPTPTESVPVSRP